MYRGYEMILIGRHPEDALATTARLCGICSTSHVVAATHALEDAWNIVPPAQAVRLRNLFLAAESLMSDARQGALFFGPGLCHPSFAGHALYDEIVQAFQASVRRVATPAGAGLLEADPRRHHGLHPAVAALHTVPAGWRHLPGRKGGDPAGASCHWTTTRAGMPRPSSAAASRTGARSPPPTVPGMGRSAPAQCHRPLHPLRHRGRRAAPGRSRQRQPAQRRALPGPDVSGPAAHPRRGAGRRPPDRVRPGAGPGAQPVLLVRRRRPAPPRRGRRHPGPQPARVLQLGHRAPVRTRQPGHAARPPGRAPRRRRPARHRPRRGRRHQRLSAPARPLDVWRGVAHPDARVVRRAGARAGRSRAGAVEVGGHRRRRGRVRLHQRHSRHVDALGDPASRPDHHLPGDHAHHVEREPSHGRPCPATSNRAWSVCRPTNRAARCGPL